MRPPPRSEQYDRRDTYYENTRVHSLGIVDKPTPEVYIDGVGHCTLTREQYMALREGKQQRVA